LLVLVTCFSVDRRNMSHYGAQAWWKFPGLVQRIIRGPNMLPCWSLMCMKDQPELEDIRLIQRLTFPGEPVAIFDLLDWTLLIDSGRAPIAPFLPSATIFTEQQLTQYRDRVARSKYLFVAADGMGFPFGVNTLLDGWSARDQFVEEARGKRLLALRNRSFRDN
jgi:hypothetical protein